MATTKKAVKFYADPSVEAHLETVPAQLRSNWINRVLAAAISREREQASKSELSDLRDWLQQQADRRDCKLLAGILGDYLADRS